MFITSACNSNCGMNNIGANILPEFFFVFANEKPKEVGRTTEIKVWLEWYCDSVTCSLKRDATMSQMCMFYCCLECQTILDPQYIVLLNQVK